MAITYLSRPMRSQRLAAKAGRPKRRAAAKSHLIKYQLASNPTRAEESDLKRALEESLKETQQQQLKQQQQEIKNGATNSTTIRNSASTVTTPISTNLAKRRNTSKQAQVNPVNPVVNSNHRLINFNNNSSYSDASRSNNTTTSSSSSQSTPNSSTSSMIKNVHKPNNSIVVNGIQTTILSPGELSSRGTTPTYSKRTRSTNSSIRNINNCNTIINQQQQQQNQHKNIINSVNNINDSNHNQIQTIDHDKNSCTGINKIININQVQKQPNKRAKLIDKAIETIHKINSSKQNYLNNKNIVAPTTSNANKKNDKTIANGNGYTTNLCDSSSSFASCSTYPTSVNVINNKNLNEFPTTNTNQRPLRTYSREKSASNNTISYGVQTIGDNLPNIFNSFSSGPSSSTPITSKSNSSRTVEPISVPMNNSVDVIRSMSNIGVGTSTVNKKTDKNKKKKKKKKNAINTSTGVSRSTQTMSVARIIITHSQAPPQGPAQFQNGSTAILQNGTLKVPVVTLSGISTSDNGNRCTFTTPTSTSTTTTMVQESNHPFKSILKTPTPDANPPPHIQCATSNSSGITPAPYLYSKRESKNDAYAKMTALKVSNSKSPSGHSKQQSSATTSTTVRRITPNANHPKTITIQSKSPPVAANPSNWSLVGVPEERLVYLRDDEPARRLLCYPAIKHIEGDVINVRDSVLLRSGAKNTDLPYIAKICAFWEDAETGNVMMSLYWYYRPEHTEEGRKRHHLLDEIFASRHRDVESVECIEDKCYVLTFNEYCRYKKRCKMEQYNVPWSLTDVTIPLSNEPYPRRGRIPDSSVSQELIFCCRQIYDSRLRRLMKNPLISPKYGHF